MFNSPFYLCLWWCFRAFVRFHDIPQSNLNSSLLLSKPLVIEEASVASEELPYSVMFVTIAWTIMLLLGTKTTCLSTTVVCPQHWSSMALRFRLWMMESLSSFNRSVGIWRKYLMCISKVEIERNRVTTKFCYKISKIC